MPKLTDYTGFIEFLEEQTFHTQNMSKCSSLRVRSPLNDKIVSIGHSYSSYVDDLYYTKKLNHTPWNKKLNSYPVKVVAVEVWWLFNHDTGLKFL